MATHKNSLGDSAQVDSITSTSPSGVYGLGAVIEIAVHFSEAIDFSSQPLLSLRILNYS